MRFLRIIVVCIVCSHVSLTRGGLLEDDGTESFGKNGVRLCRALEAVRPGERIPITVSGIYSTGHEIAMLHDPEEPYQAWFTGIEGQVVVDVRVEDGRVIEATVSVGERMLRDATLENIRSWRFEGEVTCAFETTFVYQLELRLTGASQSPRIIMELPDRVTVIGAENGW